MNKPKTLQLYCKLALAVKRHQWEDSNISSSNRVAGRTAGGHIKTLTDLYLPSGSGFDAGCRVNLFRSTPNRLVIEASFHHMNDVGCYLGWTDHTVVVKPDLADGFTLSVTGRNYRGIKEYIADVFHGVLAAEVGALDSQSPALER